VSRRLPVVLLAAAAGLPLAGCETTQELSARRAAAAARAGAGPTDARQTIGAPTRGVRIGRPVLLRSGERSAVAVTVRNAGRRALRGLPVAVRVTDGTRTAYTNATPGIQDALLRVAALRPGERAVWVNDQLPAVPAGARVTAAAGRASPAVRSVPRLVVGDLRAGHDGADRVARGTVRNHGRVVQPDLSVFVVAERRGRIVAARSFVAYLVGDPSGARLRATAPATRLQKRASR
jgi:hypothetical protein